MALFDKLFSLKRRLDSNYCESKDRGRSCQINPEQVRVLLFKECDWRGRKLLFDSSAIQRVPSGKHDKPTVRLEEVPCIVEVTDGYSYVYKGPEADASLLGEMIFGAVAMNYKSVSLKIHILDEPRRLMCTKVFCVPTTRRISKAERKPSDRSSNCLPNPSLPLNVPISDDGVALSFSMDRGDSGFCDHSSYSSVGSNFDYCSMLDIWDGSASQEDFYSFHSLPGRKLSTSSNGSWQRRTFQNIATRFELGHSQQNLLNVPTATTNDSQMYSNSSASTSDSIASGSSLPQRKNKLGIAVLITATDSDQLDLVRKCLEHCPQLQSLVCRLRLAALQAGARGKFVAVLHRASNDAARWISDLIYGPRLQPLWLTMMTSNAKVSNKLADILLSDLCSVLAVGDTKTTNLTESESEEPLQKKKTSAKRAKSPDSNSFISTLLTHVLTYHLGWVTTVSPYDTIDHQKVPSTEDAKKPYNALWAQLSDLCGSIGFPPRTARTIISGEKNTPFVTRLLTVLTYFLRCGDVKRTVFEYQQSVFKENKMVTVQSVPSVLKRTATRLNKLVDCDNVSDNTQIGDSVGTLVSSEATLRNSTLADLPRKLSSAECGCSIPSSQKPALRRNPTMMHSLKASSDSSLNSSVTDDSEAEQKVLFVLGEDEKLIGLKNKSTNGKSVKKSSKVHLEPVKLEAQDNVSEEYKARDTESPSKCCGQTLQHSKPIKHSGFKFEFDKYPQIVTNYMKSKNLELLDRHYIGKPGNLKLDNFQFDPMVVLPIQEERCETCVKCQMLESMLQTPTNASEMEYMNDMPRLSEPQFAKETLVTDSERQHRELSPKTFVRKRKENVVVVNLIKNIKSSTEGQKETNAVTEGLRRLVEASKTETEMEVSRLGDKVTPEVPICSDSAVRGLPKTLPTSSRLKLAKSSNNLSALLLEADDRDNNNLDQTDLGIRNETNATSETSLEKSNASFNLNGIVESLNDLKRDKEFKMLTTDRVLKSDELHCVELKRERDTSIQVKGRSGERERDRAIEVKTVSEFSLCELVGKTELSQRSGFEGSLLGGVTDHYVPDLILQGTVSKPISYEPELRRDLDVSSYINKQLDSPAQAVAIVGDTNTWEVRVLGRECGAGGMSSLVGAMLDALPHMCRARVPAHQCLSFLESKLREFCVLSKTLAEMLMSTDFCDIATLTKSLNIDVNDVPLLLAVATTHTPQVATRYGISYR